jgi:GH35 family endo-1,4-beta-xylanase
MGEQGGNDPARFTIIREQFNKLAISSVAFNTIGAVQGAYDFHIPDSYVSMALGNKQEMTGMHLVWGGLNLDIQSGSVVELLQTANYW